MKYSKHQLYLFFIAFAAAMGGFLFGYDTAVISGTIGIVKVKFGLNAAMEGWFVSSALVGCIVGVSFAGELSDRFGRKRTLIASALLFFISALGCSLSSSHTELISYRLVGGFGVGMASMLSPLYISEVSPANVRGQMVALYQFAITIGILSAYFVNSYLLDLSGSLSGLDVGSLWHKIMVGEVWRAMFGSEAIPALLFFIIMFFVPESPRWYALKNKNESAQKVLKKINPQKIADIEFQSIRESIGKEEKGSWNVLFHKRVRIPILAGISLAVLSQFTGINAIVYYGPRIMEEAGLKLSDALGGQVIIGVIMVLATIYAVLKMDKFGRKKLMKTGVIGMFVSLLVVAFLFQFMETQGILLLISIISFIIFFSIGFGPVIWVLLAELYPMNIRGRAMSVATLMLWVGTAIIGQIVPWMLEVLTPAGTFLIFALCCIPVPFILRTIPETKGLSLEDIEEVWRADGV